jgi:hypothetical protein
MTRRVLISDRREYQSNPAEAFPGRLAGLRRVRYNIVSTPDSFAMRTMNSPLYRAL